MTFFHWKEYAITESETKKSKREAKRRKEKTKNLCKISIMPSCKMRKMHQKTHWVAKAISYLVGGCGFDFM